MIKPATAQLMTEKRVMSPGTRPWWRFWRRATPIITVSHEPVLTRGTLIAGEAFGTWEASWPDPQTTYGRADSVIVYDWEGRELWRGALGHRITWTPGSTVAVRLTMAFVG